jgi:hypothetical protein
MQTAEFFREKADQCRAMAAGLADSAATLRGLNALALELDARALAIEASRATAREIEPGQAHQPNGDAPKQ